MTKDTKETTEYIKKRISGCEDSEKYYQEKKINIPEAVSELKAFFEEILKICQAVESAVMILPEKRERKTWDTHFGESCRDCHKQFNQAIDIAQPILAKKILECGEKDKRIKREEEYNKAMTSLAMDNAKLVDKARQELESAKKKILEMGYENIALSKRIEELEKESQHKGND